MSVRANDKFGHYTSLEMPGLYELYLIIHLRSSDGYVRMYKCIIHFQQKRKCIYTFTLHHSFIHLNWNERAMLAWGAPTLTGQNPSEIDWICLFSVAWASVELLRQRATFAHVYDWMVHFHEFNATLDALSRSLGPKSTKT